MRRLCIPRCGGRFAAGEGEAGGIDKIFRRNKQSLAVEEREEIVGTAIVWWSLNEGMGMGNRVGARLFIRMWRV